MQGQKLSLPSSNSRYRYFARCWNSFLPKTRIITLIHRPELSRRLHTIRTAAFIDNLMIRDLIESLDDIFGDENRAVLTHWSLSKTNILVNEETGEITAIGDWWLACHTMFGLELDALVMVTGYQDNGGWRDYHCKDLIMTTFWNEFFSLADIEAASRPRLQQLFIKAAKIGTLVRRAFRRNENGSTAWELIPREDIPPQVYKCLQW